jgi:hypothetical protein
MKQRPEQKKKEEEEEGQNKRKRRRRRGRKSTGKKAWEGREGDRRDGTAVC